MRFISVVIASLLSVSFYAVEAVKSEQRVVAQVESDKDVWVDIDEIGNEIPKKRTGKGWKTGKRGKSRRQKTEQMATSEVKPNPVSAGGEKSIFASKQAMAATVGLLAAAATAYAYRDEIQEASQPVLKEAGESVRWVNEEVIPKGVELFQKNIGGPVYENGEWVMNTLIPDAVKYATEGGRWVMDKGIPQGVESIKKNIGEPVYENGEWVMNTLIPEAVKSAKEKIWNPLLKGAEGKLHNWYPGKYANNILNKLRE